jgi:hypothetical protein
VRNEAERRLIERRWGTALQVDPSVNPVWHTATLPFRLISPPSPQRLQRHIRLCASANPWLPHVRLEPDPKSAANPISRVVPQPLR